MWDVEERSGFGKRIDRHLADAGAENARFCLRACCGNPVDSRLAGYEDVNDAEQLCQDPTFRRISSKKIWDRGAALTARLHCCSRFIW